MIKLKKLLELDEIKYSGKIKPKHKKRMEKELKLTHEVQVRHNPPPLNSSRETRKELEWLKHYNEGQVDEDMVKKGDNVKTAFREYCEENFLDYPKNYIKELIKESGKIIYQPSTSIIDLDPDLESFLKWISQPPHSKVMVPHPIQYQHKVFLSIIIIQDVS